VEYTELREVPRCCMESSFGVHIPLNVRRVTFPCDGIAHSSNSTVSDQNKVPAGI